MAQVIKGAFPEIARSDTKNDDKQVPSYLLHISIVFSDPLIWRRVQVPGTYTLAQLHDIIQLSMGWTDSHVHQFLVGKISYEPTMKSNTPRVSKRFDEHKYRLHSLEEGMRFMFSYIYDAGEGWEHEIRLEEVIPPTKQLKHPVLLSGEMACPPESVGDIHEYLQLVTALESPNDKNRNSLYELAGRPDFDPAYFDLEAAKKRVSIGR
ncbi:MAG: plasmid pRiA4b ORF-3 family protein [Desulforhopalus sp.]